MKHYSPEQWIDYVRATAPKRAMTEMKQHLETGCQKCESVARIWTNIVNLAQKEPGYRPPESDLRLAKSYFAMGQTEAKESWVPRVARLIFDSFRQPQLAGVRSTGPAPRHCVYRSGPMLIDVWAQPAAGPSSALLTGQILERSMPSQAVKHTVVNLRSQVTDISTTTTNQFGEFHFELTKAPDSDLHLTIGKDNPVIVLIPLRSLGILPLDNET